MDTKKIETALFGAGCFWGVEAEFRSLPGVLDTQVGYAGGSTENPSYQEVCTNETGHAEVVKIDFDPQQLSYEKLLDLFWKLHDPTSLNRQGPDEGSQYRSVIFFTTPDQEQSALNSRTETSKLHAKPIVTEILPAPKFYKAEEYHQQYLEKRGGGRCHI